MAALNIPSNFRSAEGYRQVNEFYESVLAKWGTPFETCYVPTRFGKAYVIVSGKEGAPPLVLLHGAGINSAMWQPNAEYLSQHFRLYALDIPNHAGRSEPAKMSTADY